MDDLIPCVDLPEGVSGDWAVQRFEIMPAAAALYNIGSQGRAGRYLRPGAYTRLKHGCELVMSDTPAEKRDHTRFVSAAYGDVLVTGLGLGMVANALLLQEKVRTVTVVEISADVIALSAPHWIAKWGDRLGVIHADALTWSPPRGRAWDFAWHDIWTPICGDNLIEMTRLRRHFARRVGRAECWCEREVRIMARAA